uniref:Small ribosomal subunit protein uS11c n=1 Tax=Cyanidium sp. THAL103 TaxID=3027999 RepID=A0A9Y1I4B6_9RHOD|nr:ribosomal protein S11 [Cyanidium sp. THAL103]
MVKKLKKFTKKTKKISTKGVAHVASTFNNTIITITDFQGHVINWSSAGVVGFKGAKKGTPFAAQIAADKAGKEAYQNGMKQIEIFISGPGPGRETAIRALQASGLEVMLIRDITSVPYNGCRPPNRRRI